MVIPTRTCLEESRDPSFCFFVFRKTQKTTERAPPDVCQLNWIQRSSVVSVVSVVKSSCIQRCHQIYREGKMQGTMKALIAVIAGTAVAACASAGLSPGGEATASASIRNAAGEERGTASLRQDRDNVVHVDVQVSGMPPGPHGIHFHAVGECDASGTSPFASAGAHYNPLGRQHGLDNAAGPHAGDAPNFTVAADGTGRATFTTDRVSLSEGSTTLFDGDGSAIVIHAAADDQISQPAGNAGARIACGVVQRAP
jgi:Cu-Zn family superoxide dismutase